MYGIHTAAFSATGTHQPPETNSTSDHPLNVPNCIVELAETGDVVAYYRCQGSREILFVGLNTSVPHYRKVCILKK
jgi:hypothetical protein